MKISCLNPIAAVGMQLFTDAYEKVDDFAASDAALVRSASVHELKLPDQLLAIARAVPVSIIFHWTNVQKKVLLSLIHRVQMQMV